MAILAFFDSQIKYNDSDAECQDFTKRMLTDFCFLYKHTEETNKKVCD
jgi:hypothetical protein